MTDKTLRTISALFYFSSAYDFVLGAVFLSCAEWFFRVFGVDAPNHWGYVHFPALLLVLFGIMFFQIAEDPQANRNLIPYGILLKASYCAVVGCYTFLGTIPDMWKPFGIADFLMLIAFIWAFKQIPAMQHSSMSAPYVPPSEDSGNIAPH